MPVQPKAIEQRNPEQDQENVQPAGLRPEVEPLEDVRPPYGHLAAHENGSRQRYIGDAGIDQPLDLVPELYAGAEHEPDVCERPFGRPMV